MVDIMWLLTNSLELKTTRNGVDPWRSSWILRENWGFSLVQPKKDTTNIPKKEQWETCNKMVIALLSGTVTPEVKKSLMFLNSSSEILKQLGKRDL